MHPLIGRLTLVTLLLCSTALVAQPVSFGEAFPLTNTRYHPTPGTPTLVSNGENLLVFWPTNTNIRVAKVVAGERRGGKSALDTFAPNFSVAWNGTHFLLTAGTENGIEGRLLTTTGEPAGEPFTILIAGGRPRIAWNGRQFLMLLEYEQRLYTLELDRLGRPSGLPRLLLTPPPNMALGVYSVASDGDGFGAIASVRGLALMYLFDRDANLRVERIIYSAPNNNELVGETFIASNGVNYLAAWSAGEKTFATPMSPSGIVGGMLSLDPAEKLSGGFSMVWNGSSWLVAYPVHEVGGAAPRVRVAYVDQAASRVERHEETIGGAPSLAPLNGRIVAAWRPNTIGAPVVAAPLPFGSNTPEAITHGAAAQSLGAMATSNESTLVAWQEEEEGGAAVHVGLRARDGGWTERDIALTSQSRIVAAASDGREFVLILAAGAQSEAVLLDDRARTVRRVPLPIVAYDVDWDGTQYLLLGYAIDGAIAAAKLSAGGTVSTPVSIENPGVGATPVGIATNGGTTLAAWIEHEQCPFLCIFVGRLKVVRLGGDLQRIDAVSLISSEDLINEAEIAWDGTRFLAWGGAQVVSVPLSGSTPQLVLDLPANNATNLRMTQIDGGVALAWSETGGGINGTTVNRVAIVRHDNSKTVVTFTPATRIHTAPGVAALPDGGVLYVDSRPQYAAPHHGSVRLMARVGRVVTFGRPDAPSLQAVVQNGRIRLNWTAPPQRVDGYRVEYRIGDGSWHELEQWYDPEERAVTLNWTVEAGVPVVFRVRAFNDAGTSEYSQASGINLPPRRRSVRR
jgi:hypothetical protein